MPQHKNYIQDENISENDILLGSDTDDNLKTKNYRIGKLKDYFLSFVETIVVTPRPYKVYTALLSQSGTDAPVATVLENTLGVTPTYGYSLVGEYTLISAGFFTEDKKYLFQGHVSNPDDLVASLERVDDNIIRISSATLDGVSMDELMYGQAFIEIRVYN